MTLADATIEDINSACMRALEALEGSNLYTPGPWPITVRPFAEPPTVIYQAADNETYERTMTITVEGESLNVVLGDRREVEARTVWIPLDAATAPSFSEGQGFAGKTRKSGLIFRAGDYPDKLSKPVTAQDIRDFVANFPPEGVFLMSEHDDSLIGEAMKEDGTKLLRVWSEAGDIELHGEVEYPNWLAYGLRKLKNTVSVGLDMAAKTIRELSLVKFPRVADAALFRHDAAVAFSATPVFKTFAAEHPAEAAKIITEAAKAPAPANEDMNKQTFTERLKAFFAGKTPEQRAALTEEQIAEAIATDGQPAGASNIDPSIRAEIDKLKNDFSTHVTQTEAEKAKQRDDNDAAKFYAEQLRAGKATPAEEAAVIRRFSDARFRDRHSTANFSADTPGESEKALREEFEKKSPVFKIGGGVIDSTAQPKLSSAEYGVFAGHFKKEGDK